MAAASQRADHDTTVTSGGTTWTFDQWSDGNTNASRAYEVPDAGGSLTATYDASPTPTPGNSA